MLAKTFFCGFALESASRAARSRLTHPESHRGTWRPYWLRDGVLLHYVVCIVAVLDVFTGVGALEAHISSTDPGGVVALNASLGHGWGYHLDRSRSQSSLPFLQLDSSTGLVYWRGGRNLCPQLDSNPVQIHIVSRTWQLKSHAGQNSTVVPYSVFVHGCKQSQWTRKFTRLKEDRVHQITISSELSLSQCIPPLTPLITMTDFLPHSLYRCQITVDLPVSSHVSVNTDNLMLFSAVKLCFVHGNISVEFSVSVLCDDFQVFQVPFRLTILPESHHQRVRSRTKRSANTRPSFGLETYTAHVKEEQPAGLQVITITATDTDTEGAGTLTYSMVPRKDVQSGSRFSINTLTGTINTTMRLDREKFTAHYFLIFATDHGVPPESASTTLTIIVDDINDHAPKFDQQVYDIKFPENQAVGHPVLTIPATDQDFDKNSLIRYSIINPTGPNNAFSIAPMTGSISTMKRLDREEREHYQLLIQAVDQGDLNERKSSTATVNITITDKNDNSPVFDQRTYTKNIREDHSVSNTVPIIRVTATDADLDQNAEIVYQLSGNGHEKFNIDANTGEVFLVYQLDHEDKSEFSLTVRAEDQGTPPKRGTASLVIYVIDVNDNEPYFTSKSYTGYVVENSDKDTSIVQVQAFDRDSGDNGRLAYSFVADDSGDGISLPLEIDPQTGWIRTSGRIDREHKPEYTITVKVVDNGDPKLSATSTVVIGIRDINDNPPIFTSRFYTTAVSEEARIGDEVIKVVAEDKDEGENARVRYQITSGNVGDAFQMIEINNQGVITVKKKLDARQQNRYSLTVTATDTGTGRDTVQVMINVTDTNRHAPEFQATPFHFTADENIAIGTIVFKVKAIDKDRGENARITYSLDPGITAFSIDPNTGEISTRVQLDRESTPGYMLRVTATDNGKPQLQDSEDIDVSINDKNDNDPEFSETIYSGSISEDALPRESVLKITAYDFDKDNNGEVFYTFDGGNNGEGDFSIDSALGIIRVAKGLDRERVANYELVALAVDRGTYPRSSSVVVRIKVDDVNDNGPQFEAEELSVYIMENSPVGSTVAQITATDPDEGVNALVEYSFDGGPDVDSFQLSGRRGEPAIITTLIQLDYDCEACRKRYQVNLRATSGTQFATARIFINVRDVNDNRPVLLDFSIIHNNFGKSFPTGPIGRIPAYDRDVSDRELLTYSIVSGNEAGLLHLDASTGQITLDRRLNSDVPRNGTFRVSVSDRKHAPVEATCWLHVRLVTQDMLRKSITIRFNKMTDTAFLSSLLTFFTDALATILKTVPNNIFIINIENDTDVAPAQILNVSVAARQGTESWLGGTRDVFMPPEFLREYIYLHRSLLANLSALQVLPFDDNLCLSEPCGIFANCLSTSPSGEARPFIASNTVLFRPIHPRRYYKCVCPIGYAGKENAIDCDVEIDLCYYDPCKNGGTCFPHENGYECSCPKDFTGKDCQVNRTARYDSISCPHHLCQPPSVCVPLIKGGFRCDGCPDDGYHDHFCRLRTASFKKGSYMTFPSIKSRNRFNITLRFATQEKDGLLFYNGRFNEEHDYLGLEVVDSQVVFSFSLGENRTTLTSHVPGGVSTGQWIPVTVHYHSRVATLTVGEGCDTNIAIMYGDRLGNYSCAARIFHQLPEICKIYTERCHRFFDLTGPFQLGGMPWAPSTGQVAHQDFIGCISDVHIDRSVLDLNSSVVSVQTDAGCPQKKTHCQSAPCTLGGKCQEGWTTFTCDCPERAGGKDCSQVIEAPRQLRGSGHLSYSSLPQSRVHYPWYNGLAFRTRAHTGTLMHVVLDVGYARLQVRNGFIEYRYGNNSVVLDSLGVNDGRWHYAEARWFQGRLELLLDYGQRSSSIMLTESVAGRNIKIVYVGGYRQGNEAISDGFVGCVKDVRVGNNVNAVLSQPRETGVEPGCSAPNACQQVSCGPGSCVDLWGDHTCHCPPGTIGPQCENICTEYNPCENWAECKYPSQGESTYTCQCGSRQSGRYCQNVAPLECAAGWWGNPICGPCKCDVNKGFYKSCDKKNGTCYCKELHYQPADSDQCLPCDCYSLGSTGPVCDPHTGQCPCRTGIYGRRCDQCDNIFASIDTVNRRCKVWSYDDCPRNRAAGVWWDQVPFGDTAVQDCPNGTTGTAKRKCTKERSWLDPDMFNCTNDKFAHLREQLVYLEADAMTVYSANLAVEELANATMTTPKLYGGDILLTLQVVNAVLAYENQQSGLALVSQQHRSFVQKLAIALGNVTSLANLASWQQINTMGSGAGGVVRLLESYLLTLAKNMMLAQSGPFEAASDNIVLGADWMLVYNVSNRPLPKYDNIINKGSSNDYASIVLPSSLFPGGSGGEKAYFGYGIYHTLGKLMEMNTDGSIVETGLPLTTNGPLLSLMLTSGGQLVSGRLKDPVYVRIRLDSPHNTTNLQCATWTPSGNGPGVWSSTDCSVSDRDCRVVPGSDECQQVYVTCQCFHLSSYAVIIDLEDGTLPRAVVVQLSVLMYLLVGLSLVLLLLAFFVLISYKLLHSNWNSIHTNLIFVIIIIELAFAVGVNRTTPELFCRLVAISLHYFYMAAFAWLFVEMLHIYRMLTEKQTINYGSMKFYYLLGYVIPGIIVGLAVGLYTDGYGNDRFCWLETSDMFIWTFAGPIVVVVVLNVIMFTLAVKASCREKVHVTDISSIRLGLMGAITLLLLLSVTWVTGLLTVNFDLESLGYVHALFLCLQGVFLFLIYVLLSRKVRLCLKSTWYKIQGKKFNMDDNLAGTRSSVMSRSALAYNRNDTTSSTEGGLRINVGISTTSTTSQSSKSTARYPHRYRGDDLGRSTSSSTSGHGPSVGGQFPNTGVAPYGYNPSAGDILPEEELVDGKSPRKPEGHDSDSDSDASVDRNSLDLASSHSSDEDDDFEIGPPWDQHIPKSKAVAQAREQLEKHKKEKERERLGNNNADEMWADSGQVDISLDLDPPLTSRPHISSVPPDVTLSAAAQRSARKVTIMPPVRSDSLLNNCATGSSPATSDVAPSPTPADRVQVQVLTHNGSLSSESESSDETNV